MNITAIRKQSQIVWQARHTTKVAEERLAEIINKELGLGQACVLMTELGCSAQFLSDVRRGRRRIGAPLLDRMCAAGLKKGKV